MALRVDNTQTRQTWGHGLPSWDMGQQKKKHRNQGADQHAGQESDTEDAPLYNAKGDLLPPSGALKISI